jgi:hypothetical protein
MVVPRACHGPVTRKEREGERRGERDGTGEMDGKLGPWTSGEARKERRVPRAACGSGSRAAGRRSRREEETKRCKPGLPARRDWQKRENRTRRQRERGVVASNARARPLGRWDWCLLARCILPQASPGVPQACELSFRCGLGRIRRGLVSGPSRRIVQCRWRRCVGGGSGRVIRGVCLAVRTKPVSEAIPKAGGSSSDGPSFRRTSRKALR